MRLLKKCLSILLFFAILFSIIPIHDRKIAYASTAHNPFIENEAETITVIDNNLEGNITLEQAKEIARSIYSDLYYVHDFNFERSNGERYYVIRIKDWIEDHYTSLTQLFISFDGKVCVEGWNSGTSITAYNNTNLITVKEDALEAYNKMLSADMITFYTNYYSEDEHITSINIDASDCQFAIVYIDGDRIPELVIKGGTGTYHSTGSYNLFTYKDGNIKYITNPHDEFTYYEKTGIYSTNYTGMGASTYTYYNMYPGSIVFSHAYYYYTGVDGYNNVEKYYNSDHEEISDTEYQELVKNLCGKQNELIPTYYENTSENRKNILGVLENGDEEKHQKSIAVFTTNKSMKIKTGKSMWMGFSLLDENSGLLDDKWKKMSVVVSDPTVISLSDYTKTEYGYSLEIIGKKQGATNITITDTENGINTIITVFVQDDYVNTYSYAIDNIASFYPNNEFEKNIETNIYDLNGLYVNKYQCTKSTNSYNVSFDIYNSKYYSGAVDIYDENGMWMGYEEIEKYSDISGFWDTGEQAYFLVSDTNTGKMLTYEQASFSKYTHIDIEVPEGGYFTISNNISESPGTFFINAFEILFEGSYTVFDLFTSGGTKESALTSFKKEAKKSFATRLIEARNEGLKNNVKRQSQKIMLDSMKSKIKKITKESIKSGLKDKLKSTDTMCSNIASLAEDMLAPQSFNIEWKPMFESATGIGESFFTKFAGPAGIALEGCFALNDATNKILMAKQMAESAGNPYVTIFSSVDAGYINPYGVMVNTNGNIDAESVLQVFRVSDSDVIEVLLDSSNPLEIHELYNICFVKDDTLVQPNGKVMVQIPIPQGMKGNTCKVYRQETNGNWTILDARVQGNYLVFETEHFSLYALVGESDTLVINSLPDKTNYQDGEILDTSGLVINLNGQLITDGYICEPTVLSGNGKQLIKVIYGHSSTEFEVNVEKTETPTNTPQTTTSPNVTSEPTLQPTKEPTVTAKPTNTPTITAKPTIKPTNIPDVTVKPTMKPNNTSGSSSGKATVGKKFKVSSAQYKITSVGTKKTVEYMKPDKNNIRLVIVPTKVKYKGVSYKVTSIGKNAFLNCNKIQQVDIGKNVTKIGNSAFQNCKKLNTLTIGKNVTKIGSKAFYKCKKLRYILVKSRKLKAKNIGSKAFASGYKSPRLKSDKSKWKLYSKIFLKKGLSKKTIFIIDPVKLKI